MSWRTIGLLQLAVLNFLVAYMRACIFAHSWLYLPLTFCWFLSWLTAQNRRRRWNFFLNLWAYIRLHNVASQKIVLFLSSFSWSQHHYVEKSIDYVASSYAVFKGWFCGDLINMWILIKIIIGWYVLQISRTNVVMHTVRRYYISNHTLPPNMGMSLCTFSSIIMWGKSNVSFCVRLEYIGLASLWWSVIKWMSFNVSDSLKIMSESYIQGDSRSCRKTVGGYWYNLEQNVNKQLSDTQWFHGFSD
jgi:hypothetical protein